MDPEFIYEIITINQKHLNLEFPNIFIAKNYQQFVTDNFQNIPKINESIYNLPLSQQLF